MLSYLQNDVEEIKTILGVLPASPYHQYMNNLIDFLVSRMH